MSLLQLQALGGRRSRAGGQTGEPDSQDASGFDGDGPRLSTQVFHHAPAATSFHDLIKELKSSRRSAWLVNPNSTGMKAWDIVVLLLLLFTATVTPYEVAFLSAALGDPSSTKISQFDGLFFVNRIVDVLFLVDIVFQFFTPYRATDGTPVTKHRALAARYLRSWFIVDLVSILPFDLLGLLVDSSIVSSLKLLRIVRLLRLVKLTRILRASRIFARWERLVNISHSMVSITKFLLTVMFVSHLTACLFRIVPELEQATDAQGEPVNWVTALNEKLPAPLDLNSPEELFAAALYWSVMTMTTIGYGDVVPITHWERIYTTGVMLVGGIVYAYVVGGICALIASIDLASEEYYQILDMATAFTRDANLPEVLRRRVRHFIMSGRNMHRRRFYWRLLKEFSPHLRSEVCRAIATPLLSEASFLLTKDQSERRRFLGHIGQLLRFQHCVPDEVVFRAGVVLRQIYVVERGTVVCLGPFLMGAKRSTLIPRGGYFGIQALLRRHRTLYAAVARDATELVTLDKSALLAVLDPHQYPNTCALVRGVAIRLSFHMAVVGKHPLYANGYEDQMVKLVSRLDAQNDDDTLSSLHRRTPAAWEDMERSQAEVDAFKMAASPVKVDMRKTEELGEEMKEGTDAREKKRSLRPKPSAKEGGRSSGGRERRRERGSRDGAHKGRGLSSSRKPRRRRSKKKPIWRSQEVLGDAGTEAESDEDAYIRPGGKEPGTAASSAPPPPDPGNGAVSGEVSQRMAALEQHIASLDDSLQRTTTGVLMSVILLLGFLAIALVHSVASQ